MKKIAKQNKELESVAGGCTPNFGADLECSNCGFRGCFSNFHPKQATGKCTDGTRYTCPKCGYSRVK